MKDHSQNGEQAIILRHFGDHIGTALDIGSNDGITFSNVHALHLLGWSVTYVEPSPSAFTKLNALHAQSDPILTCLINAAINSVDGEIDFWDSGTHLKQGDTALLSTAKPEEMTRWGKSGETFKPIKVRGITFNRMMEESQRDQFDFISIDCEGLDYEVMIQMNLEKLGCRMLCVETNSKEDEKYIAYAKRFGMRLLHKNHENLIFVK